MANTNGFDPVAFSIDGGRHRAELLRVLPYAYAGGVEGRVSGTDCKVHQLTTPAGQVAIDAGAAIVRNRSANAINQSYVASARSQSVLDVAPTGAAARSDLLVIRVKDPQYSPWSLPNGADAATYQYVEPFIIQNVAATTKTAKELNLGYSAVELARIDIPANTTNILDSMIKPLGQVARAQRESDVFTLNNSATYTLNTAGLIDWPLDLKKNVDIPLWATHCVVSAFITQVDPIWSTVAPVASNGWLTIALGTLQALGTVWEVRSATEPTMTIGIADTLVIPASMRGTTQTMKTRGNRNTGNAALRFNAGSAGIVNYTFQERVV